MFAKTTIFVVFCLLPALILAQKLATRKLIAKCQALHLRIFSSSQNTTLKLNFSPCSLGSIFSLNNNCLFYFFQEDFLTKDWIFVSFGYNTLPKFRLLNFLTAISERGLSSDFFTIFHYFPYSICTFISLFSLDFSIEFLLNQISILLSLYSFI